MTDTFLWLIIPLLNCLVLKYHMNCFYYFYDAVIIIDTLPFSLQLSARQQNSEAVETVGQEWHAGVSQLRVPQPAGLPGQGLWPPVGHRHGALQAHKVPHLSAFPGQIFYNDIRGILKILVPVSGISCNGLCQRNDQQNLNYMYRVPGYEKGKYKKRINV